MAHQDENPTESLDREGMPGDLFDQPPGVDIETEEEGLVAPREHSLATGSDPAYANTAREERFPESVADRAAREQPDFGMGGGADEQPLSMPHLLGPDLDEAGEDDEGGAFADPAEDEADEVSPEEAAMRVGSEDEADDVDPALERAEYLEGR